MALVALLLLSSLNARAQEVPEMDAQLYRLPVDAERTLWADDSATGPDAYWRARLGFNYMRDPLVYRYANGDETRVLGDALAADLVAGVDFAHVRIGLDVPLWLLTTSDLADNGGGLGDIALDVKGTVLDREDGPVGVALGGRVSLPTATVALPVGSAGPGWSLQAIVDKEFGPVLVAANLGTQGVPATQLDGVEWNDQFFYRLGAGYSLTEDDKAGISADLAGRATYGDLQGAGAPLEGLLGTWCRFNTDWVARLGVGTGLTSGIGAPDIRLVAAIGYEPPKVRDSDGDGILDKVDACRDQPEDMDGWQDADGCPDPTTLVAIEVLGPDQALIADAVTVVETPGEATQGTGELSLELHPGRWPLKVTADRYAPHDETLVVPEGESFKVVVTMDPLFGQVKLSVTDLEGNPIEASVRAGDAEPVGTAGGSVTFEADAGEASLMVQAEGFSPRRMPVNVVAGDLTEVSVKLAPARAKVTKEKIEILDKVFFDTGKATIKAESFGLLNDVAALLDANPDVKKVRVEGHTDSRGSARANLALSQSRADSVKQYLVEKGIAADRLEAVGYGEDKPIDPKNNAAAWDKNRRVEFTILERKP